MRFTPRKTDALFDSLEPVIAGLGMVLVEASSSRRHGGGVHIKITVYKAGGISLEDCSRAHRALIPRLDLAFSQEDYSVEVSSPGTDRLIKDASEFALFIGRGARCYRTDISDWTGGVITGADDSKVELQNSGGIIPVAYKVIAKAKLDKSYEV